MRWSSGATAIGMFTRNQRIWNQRPLADEDAAAFRGACREHGFAPRHVLPHDSYLINLGSSDAEVVAKSRVAFLDEMRRCQMLGALLPELPPRRPQAGREDVQRALHRADRAGTSTRRWSRPKA